MERTYSQIDMDERRKIARWKTAGISVTVIVEKFGRHRSTIFSRTKSFARKFSPRSGERNSFKRAQVAVRRELTAKLECPVAAKFDQALCR